MANFYTENKNLKFHLTHPDMRRIVAIRENDFEDRDAYDYAPMDYEDAIDSYEKILEVMGQLSAEVVAENAESVDQEGAKLVDNQVHYAAGTKENHEALTQAGLYGVTLPRKYGGLNFSIVPYVVAAELVARGDASFANIWGLQDCAETINEFASEELKEKYLPMINQGYTAAMDLTEPDAGSDLQKVQLKATYNEETDTWYLNGVKRFITNGDADVSLVLARSEQGTSDARGLSLFLYDKKHQARQVRRLENKLGIKGSPTCELVFKDAPATLIGNERMGLIKYVMSLMNSARLGVGAQSVGIAEAAYREAEKYAKEREQFGKTINNYPAIYEMLTSMKVRIDAMRTLLYETARSVDLYKSYSQLADKRALTKEEKQEQKKVMRKADILTPLQKLMNSEYCNQIAYDSLQVHGGSGYMKDFPIERIYRDARITNIYEGTSQLQVVAASKGVSNKTYLKLIKEYEEIEINPELEYLRKLLAKMTQQYEKVVNRVLEEEDNEFFEFHSRRLVEIAYNIISGHLLLLDANRDSSYKRSADLFIKMVRAENISKVGFINNFTQQDMSTFKF
ncbi:MAG: acyl-CoA dehydrogenase family protein [Bacteroidales bacterium]|nr:acyl-CoA dehydrogenase family protein [Bacteroidales bacterium]MCF8333543.1 acyl-CoA dehydrogenase family protein [Bacteroidales bacterium]